jgi:hypothetical protein
MLALDIQQRIERVRGREIIRLVHNGRRMLVSSALQIKTIFGWIVSAFKLQENVLIDTNKTTSTPIK